MKKFLVIGNPIDHSLSPKLHNYWINENNIKALYEKRKLNENDLKVNIQGQINYYDATKGAYLHVEVDKVDAGLNNDLGIVSYLIEDSLIGDQKMPDNSHNSSYVHRDTHRSNLSGSAFGRNLTSSLMSNNKYYVDYSFVVPNQLDGNHNPSNMHVLVYVYDLSTLEVYQVIKLPFQ